MFFHVQKYFIWILKDASLQSYKAVVKLKAALTLCGIIQFTNWIKQQNWSKAHIIFMTSLVGKGVLNKDPIVWHVGVRPPPMYAFKNSQIVMVITTTE